MKTRLFVLASAAFTLAACAHGIARTKPATATPFPVTQQNTKTGMPPIGGIQAPAAGPIADPSNFHGTGPMATSSTTIDLSWIDNSNNEDNFRICRKGKGVAAYNPSTIVVLPANTTKYHATGLDPETTYTFGLAASNSTNYSFMMETDATTNPRPPADLKAQAMGAAKVKLTWTNKSNIANLIMIERSMGNSSSFQKIFQTSPISISSYEDAAVSANTKYFYRLVVLKLPFNASDYTASVSVVTSKN